MGGLRLTALAAVVAAFLIAPAALLADEGPVASAGDEPAYSGDQAGEADIATADPAAEDETADDGAVAADEDGVTADDDAADADADDESVTGGDDAAEATEAGDGSIETSGDDGSQPTASASATTAVSIGDFFYRPQDVTVHVGDTVDWTNDGTVPEGHTVTGDGFDSGVLKEGDTYAHTFPTAGSFDYVCTLHPNMRGTVTVTGTTGAAGDTPAPTGGGSGTGAVPSTAPTTATASGTGDSSGSLASTGLNLILLAEIGGCLLATGMLVHRLRYGWPF